MYRISTLFYLRSSRNTNTSKKQTPHGLRSSAGWDTN